MQLAYQVCYTNVTKYLYNTNALQKYTKALSCQLKL